MSEFTVGQPLKWLDEAMTESQKWVRKRRLSIRTIVERSIRQGKRRGFWKEAT